MIFDHPPYRLGAADACAGRIGRHAQIARFCVPGSAGGCVVIRWWRRGLAGQCSACACWNARWLPRRVRLGRRSMEGSVSGGPGQGCISGVMRCSGLVSGALPLPPGRRKVRPPSGATPEAIAWSDWDVTATNWIAWEWYSQPGIALSGRSSPMAEAASAPWPAAAACGPPRRRRLLPGECHHCPGHRTV